MDGEMLEKLQAVMSDPESMQQIQELAKLLEVSDSGSDAGTKAKSQTPLSDASASQEESTVQQTQAAEMPFDFGRLMQLTKLMQGSSGSDTDTALLLALKPHLKQERQKKVDQAIRLLRMYTLYKTLQESGMLRDLF